MNQANFTRAFSTLTVQRKNVLRLFLAGKQDTEIAKELGIEPTTVRKHIQNICEVFCLNNEEVRGYSHRAELTALCFKYGAIILGDIFPNSDRFPNSDGGVNIPKVVLSYHWSINPDQSLHTDLNTALKDRGFDVFVANVNLRMANDGMRQIYAELNRCDRLILLLSNQAASSEMVTEEVRWAKTLHDTKGKPEIFVIRLNCPLELLNHDLRGYLKEMPQYEWKLPEDTPRIVKNLWDWLASGKTEVTVPNPEQYFPKILYSVTPNYPPQPVAEPELPRGQVKLASVFYVERQGIEKRCYEAIAKPGSLIRIKAPRQMGKTSLMARILDRGTQKGYVAVPLTFQLADSKVFSDLERFLRWFCAVIALKLQLPDRLGEYWHEIYGSKASCSYYFEQYLLTQITEPIVLGLDEVDRLFQYPEIAADFFGLLRSWHEDAKNREIWRKIRLVVVHSTEVYVPMDINQSPFNVGLPLELPQFNLDQVQDLAYRHGLPWQTAEVEKLMAMVGGHPYLVRLALYHISRQEISLDELLANSATDTGLYADHLRQHLWNLSQYPELVVALKKVVMADNPVQLESIHGLKLYSMGLVRLQGNEVIPCCDLYRQYFRSHLS